MQKIDMFCVNCKNKDTLECKMCNYFSYHGEVKNTPTYWEPCDDESKENNQRHMNGLLFDDLVYRYKYALEMATEARADSMFCMGTSRYTTKKEAMGAARKQNERDVIKFCQLLDEAIGDRD